MNFVRSQVKDGKITLGENSLDMAPVLGSETGAWEGKTLVFGFRPEAVELGAREDAYHVKCQVELTEMLGDTTNVYIAAGEERSILKIDPHDTPDIDAQITFSIPYENVYLFDNETERVIRRKAAAIQA